MQADERGLNLTGAPRNTDEAETLLLAFQMERSADACEDAEAASALRDGARRLRYVMGGLQCASDACDLLADEPNRVHFVVTDPHEQGAAIIRNMEAAIRVAGRPVSFEARL